jgi:hypothetical protein
MAERDYSELHSKLDRLLEEHSRWTELMEGRSDAPGFLMRLRQMEILLLGKEGSGGLVSKVNVLWRVQTWFLATGSAGVGALLTLLIEKLAKYI